MVIGLSDTIYQLFYLSQICYVIIWAGPGGEKLQKAGRAGFFPGELKIFRARPFGELI